MGACCLAHKEDHDAIEVPNPTNPKPKPTQGKVQTATLSKSPIRLHYFNVRNRAEFIRWIFAYKSIQYEDIRVSFEAWPTVKSTFEFGQMPVLEMDGKKLVTAVAIGRHVALKTGLYPTDIDEVYESESLVDFIGDFLNAYDKIAFKDNDWAGWDKYLTTDCVQRLKIAEARLNKRNSGRPGFFLGATVSMVDFVVAAYVHSHYFLPTQEHRLAVLASEVPALKAFVEHFLHALPAVASYIATRPVSMA
jgi:glutathione S-transferase